MINRLTDNNLPPKQSQDILRSWQSWPGVVRQQSPHLGDRLENLLNQEDCKDLLAITFFLWSCDKEDWMMGKDVVRVAEEFFNYKDNGMDSLGFSNFEFQDLNLVFNLISESIQLTMFELRGRFLTKSLQSQ